MATPTTTLTQHLDQSAEPAPERHGGVTNGGNGQTIATPAWDASRRELRLGATVVKRFHRPAPLLEAIAAAFQEECWNRRIDDPLRQSDGVDPKQRLHDAIKALNRCQSPHMIRFYGDGTGSGICWELARSRDQDTPRPSR